MASPAPTPPSLQTICNPLNLNYRFSVRGKADTSFREAADPSLVYYPRDDAYYLFPSVSGGYWRSADLVSWRFIPSTVLPTEDYAPDVRVLNNGEAIYFTASRHPPSHCPIFKSARPELGDSWGKVSEPMPYWDPNIFQDDDGRVYLFHGCTNKRPMFALELDRETMLPLADLSKQKPVIFEDAKHHGWERLAENNNSYDYPYIEGAWMDKHKGRYYLQYASPSTLINVYNDAVYESDDSPLGPFHCAPHNPFSFKPGGFMTGAGHGSTFRDRHGNWWHTSTMRITVHHIFERRLGLWPAGFDDDGVLFCNTRFGDYPMLIPSTTWKDPWVDPFPGWMLLSYKKPVSASSALERHPASYCVNEDCRTWWIAAQNDGEPCLALDLENPCRVCAVQINFAEHECDQYERDGDRLYYQYALSASDDGETWTTFHDQSQNTTTDAPHDYVVLDEPLNTRHIRLSILHVAGGGIPAVSGLRVFGKSPEDPPPAPRQVTVFRDVEDPCIAEIAWARVPNATGYNVRWGIAETKLYSCWMVLEAESLVMRCLNSRQNYVVAVEAFNAAGVSDLSALQQM